MHIYARPIIAINPPPHPPPPPKKKKKKKKNIQTVHIYAVSVFIHSISKLGTIYDQGYVLIGKPLNFFQDKKLCC